MFRPSHVFTILIIAVVIAAVLISCAAPAAKQSEPGSGLEGFISSLQKGGFTLKPVPFIPVDLIRLYESGRLANAAGNNAGAPYRAVFAAGPENLQMSDIKQLSNADVWEKMETQLYGIHTLIQGWQLNPDEALVIVGRTPPQCAYFSYCGFVFYKYYEKEQGRKWVWASFNDPLNNLTIKTLGTRGGKKGNPFDQDVIIVITADRGTDKQVRNAAAAAGYSRDIINTYVVPGSLLKLGTGPDCDSIVFGQRMALFADENKGQEYVNTISVAIKVTPTAQGKPDPFPAPEVRVRGTGKTEVGLQPALDELRRAILAKYSSLAASELETHQWLSESYDAIQRGEYVAGESRDTVYLRSSTFTLGDAADEFAVAYGVNHAASGKATYSNCSFYGEAGWNGVAGIYSPDLTGSADAFLPGNPLAKYLYVCKFARTCNGEKTCVAVATGPVAHGVKLDEPAFIGFRAYMEPSTRVGPAYSELLYDRVIKFSPR